jgi:hypothetical protein
MKKRKLLYAALILSVVIALSSCFFDHDISISVNDDEDVYRMKASFDEDLTNEVQKVINAHLRKHHSGHLVYPFTDREITLDDGTSFYIKTGPGRVKIKIDKTENPEEGFESVREMCDEIKEVLAGERDHE